MNEIQQQRDNLRERGSALGRAIDIYFEPAPQLREMLSMLVVCPRNGFTSPACTRRDRRNPRFPGRFEAAVLGAPWKSNCKPVLVTHH